MNITLNISVLLDLLRCHATPGDETEVAAFLERTWSLAGLEVRRHGHYAVSACPSSYDAARPTMLVCAHMDSPGFSVECMDPDRVKLVSLGGVRFEGDQAAGIMKTSQGNVEVVTISKETDDGGEISYYAPRLDGVTYGDRVCFEAKPVVEEGLIKSPFLDNRLGCFVLCELARQYGGQDLGVNMVVGATACEELGGFGAPVLARAVQPDLVVCVDATYAEPKQDVHIGKGPVLTLSDASAMISCQLRDRIVQVFADAFIPLQTEVYNYSGTDSRAFPHQGLPAVVLPLLLPTDGNHSPEETGSLADVENLLKAIPALARRHAEL